MHLRLPASFQKTRSRPARRVEDPINIGIKNYLEINLPDEWIVHHSRNESSSESEGCAAKKKGMKRGYPDLIIHGWKDVGTLTPLIVPWSWLVEVKAPGRYPDSDQRRMHAKFKELGFPVAVARSIDDMRDLVLEWGLPSRDYLVVRAREKALQEDLRAP